MQVKLKKLDERAILPTRGSTAAAGLDLYALDAVTVGAGETVLVHTGIALAIPEGYAGFIYARSGIATKRGLAPANKVGVIDADYRGEIMVALHNHSMTEQTVDAGERVAQLVVAPFLSVELDVVEALDETERASGGFGSTGKN
ncbi:MAG: dUTP diphosphatase [Ruminococcaceae bacterium]|nr:dUTP diphosphatase [Oscillospiraceae bacterium]